MSGDDHRPKLLAALHTAPMALARWTLGGALTPRAARAVR